MENNKILISIIVPTHNRADALARTLEHLSRQSFRETWEAVVVNNNCTDDTNDVVWRAQANFPVPLRLVDEKKPGPAAARNRGARASSGEYLIFMDNDILTAPDFIERHYRRLKENPGCWIVSQPVNLPEQEATVFGAYRKTLFPAVPPDAGLSETDSITGQGTSMPRTDFERLGGFDENFFVASGEDRELAMRAQQELGIKILFDPGIVIGHNDWAGATIRDFCKRQRLYTQTEPFFWRKYGDRHQRLEMVRKNTPPDWKNDGIKLFAWKHLKKMLGTDFGQSAMIGLCEVSEKSMPNSPILRRLYRLAAAGAIYRGFQEGLQFSASAPPAAAAAAPATNDSDSRPLTATTPESES